MEGAVIMATTGKKDKEKVVTASDAVKQAVDKTAGEMKELGDKELDKLSGAGDPFANHPRVSNKKINGTVRKNG